MHYPRLSIHREASGIAVFEKAHILIDKVQKYAEVSETFCFKPSNKDNRFAEDRGK